MEENVVFSTNIATIAQTGNNKRLFNRKMVIRTIKVHPYYEVVLSNKKEATIDIHSTFLSLQRITLGGRGERRIPKGTYYMIPCIKHFWGQRTKQTLLQGRHTDG